MQDGEQLMRRRTRSIGVIGACGLLLLSASLVQAAPADVPAFCPLSRLGLEHPADLKPRRPVADECLFRADDRRLYVEIKPLKLEDYEIIAKAGKIESRPAGAMAVSDERVEIAGRPVFLTTYGVKGQNQPRIHMIAVTRIGDVAVRTEAVVQLIKLAGYGVEPLRQVVLSAQMRAPLTPEQQKSELPVWMDDFAGFTLQRATNTSVFLGAGADDPTGAGKEVSIRISLPFSRAPETPSKDDVRLTQLLDDGLPLDPSRTVETQEIVERDGLNWYEFKATGAAEGYSEPVLAVAALRLEPSKRIVTLQAIMPLKDRARYEDRIRTLADNISWK
jgi:hypothetical protein